MSKLPSRPQDSVALHRAGEVDDPDACVALFGDPGERYLSKLYDVWMEENGFL